MLSLSNYFKVLIFVFQIHTKIPSLNYLFLQIYLTWKTSYVKISPIHQTLDVFPRENHCALGTRCPRFKIPRFATFPSVRSLTIDRMPPLLPPLVLLPPLLLLVQPLLQPHSAVALLQTLFRSINFRFAPQKRNWVNWPSTLNVTYSARRHLCRSPTSCRYYHLALSTVHINFASRKIAWPRSGWRRFLGGGMELLRRIIITVHTRLRCLFVALSAMSTFIQR